jgi:hypothetical protein
VSSFIGMAHSCSGGDFISESEKTDVGRSEVGMPYAPLEPAGLSNMGAAIVVA